VRDRIDFAGAAGLDGSMPTVLRSLVACALLYAAAAANAAEPATAVASVLPATANAAFLVRRDGLVFLRGLLDEDPALRRELHEFLLRTVGVDLSTTDGVAGWLESVDPPVGAVLLTLPAPGDFRGPVVGDEGGVPLHMLGRATAALVPKVGVLIGSELAVRDGVHALQTPSARATWASALDAASDLQIVSLASAFRDPQITAAAQQFGAQWASLSMRHDNHLRLEVVGDGARLQALLQQAEIVVNVMLEKLRQQKERLEQGDDVLAGAGVLVTGSVVTAGEARTLLGGSS
jgi:dihydrofolate synthase/folylpolyglutamate synthase